ncbi:PLP-dependent aminotransferase family protein [Enterobacter kobei]|uniref:MocR-like pyridoxine biosynthesis transcription factor PdxR n=1 Tax=Enterobacter TaxID=547 RepID=UPI0006D95138|nr:MULTISPECIES: PLP-dependent aminotransferase family protein [Enterobacter]MBH0127127.1 PLP-dependent aminotransferase family protein [Enterobacter sp. SECR18-0236]MCA1254435.1 PLP-dependent aminotransferase family protein [Enterobacter kobei]MCD2483335.1 PLP-dependent aminotransferase family protein [Enterobacter kobei]MCD2507058.1 PLP-dependent aminotransferase family protein [Enterobacter kobei]OEG92432.1 DNA-binding protein [Enterobacter kobei]
MNIPGDEFYTLLHAALKKRGDETLQRALYLALREAILSGKLQSGSQLSGSRTLAQQLAVSRNTVNAALDQLTLEGYLLRNRQGTKVAQFAHRARVRELPAPEVVLAKRVTHLPAPVQRDTPVMAFTPGTPAINYFPLPLWRRLYDRVLREEGNALLGYGDPAGEPSLRAAIARHLALSRGIDCDASQIVITEGALEGVNLCTILLSEPGDVAWVENPGYAGAKSAFVKTGLTMTGMPVDDEGMCWDGRNAPSPTLIFTSPSHQFPYGSVLSARRRLALLELARQHNAWIIEDDYDSEFRYAGEPVPAMLGMVNNAPVVYLGTFSKTLFPSLRMGFMVLPPALAKASRAAIGSLLRGGHRAEQRTLALFIEEGHYARHLAAMRRLYRKRYRQLREALSTALHTPHRILAGEGGMHLTVTINGIDDQRLVEKARAFQLAPAALSGYYLEAKQGQTGLVLGYGNTSASQFVPGIRRLQALITQQQGGKE